MNINTGNVLGIEEETEGIPNVSASERFIPRIDDHTQGTSIQAPVEESKQ